MESLNSQSVLPPDPPLWVKLGSEIAALEFLPYISFIVAFIASECIKRYWESIRCILSFTACLLKPQSILNFKGRFAFVSKSIPLVSVDAI